MPARLLALLTCLVAACTTAPSSSASQGAASRPQADDPAALLPLCQRACEIRSQPRAVAAEVITRECEDRCATVPSWPSVDSGVAARQQLGRSVRLSGVLSGTQILLSDGVQVNLRGAVPPGLTSGQSVIIVGQLDSEAEAGFVMLVSFAAPSRSTR